MPRHYQYGGVPRRYDAQWPGWPIQAAPKGADTLSNYTAIGVDEKDYAEAVKSGVDSLDAFKRRCAGYGFTAEKYGSSWDDKCIGYESQNQLGPLFKKGPLSVQAINVPAAKGTTAKLTAQTAIVIAGAVLFALFVLPPLLDRPRKNPLRDRPFEGMIPKGVLKKRKKKSFLRTKAGQQAQARGRAATVTRWRNEGRTNAWIDQRMKKLGWK